MNWQVVLPLKGIAARKTRLSDRLPATRRRQLSGSLFEHTVRVCMQSHLVDDIILLSDLRPPGWLHSFVQDQGHGLNAELAAAIGKLRRQPALVLLPDLPLLSLEDVQAMLEIKGAALSIAPDRWGTGTNALALREANVCQFDFGPGSFQKHVRAASGKVQIVRRLGLALDIDTGDDLDEAISLGFRPSGEVARPMTDRHRRSQPNQQPKV